MVPLPIEILQRICELAAERVVRRPHVNQETIETSDSTNIHFMTLLGFSRASWAFRQVSVPYVFRRLKVRTAERALDIVRSSIAQYARHIHFPVIDVLTCRRPIHYSVLQLASQATSIRISAKNPSFFYTALTPLSNLLSSAKGLVALELYCEPITYGFDTLALIGKNLIPTCPKSLKTLYITMPGGQPDYTGPDKLLGALSPCAGTDHPLSELEFIHLAVHLSSQVASCPEELAMGIAQRLPALRRVSLVALPRQAQQKSSLFELVGSRWQSQDEEHPGRDATNWRVSRDACTGDGGDDSQSRDEIKLEEDWQPRVPVLV